MMSNVSIGSVMEGGLSVDLVKLAVRVGISKYGVSMH
jgi:hypothetical protein